MRLLFTLHILLSFCWRLERAERSTANTTTRQGAAAASAADWLIPALIAKAPTIFSGRHLATKNSLLRLRSFSSPAIIRSICFFSFHSKIKEQLDK